MPPAQIGQYRLGAKLGEGGMGIVYAAEDEQLHRKVAVKLLRSEWTQEPKAVERFHREARITAELHHPHICAVYDFGEREGYHYLVTELLEGQPLRDRLDGWPLPIEPMLDIAIQVADAIEAAHAKGVIHRDIKSSNIFITDTGIAKLFDFGLAKLNEKCPHGLLTKVAVSEVVSMPGITLGTVTHMSPEQVAGKELDHRSDIFSFGIVLYEMATGVLPFHGIDSVMIMQAIACEGYPQPTKINPNLPAELDEIIGKSLQKDCADRYQNMAELKTDLIRLLQQLEHGPGSVTSSTGAIVAREAEAGFQPKAQMQPEAVQKQSPRPVRLDPLVVVEQWNVKGGGGRRFIANGCGTMYWFHASLGEVASPAGFRDSLQPALESPRITQIRFVLDPAEDGTPQMWSKLVVPLLQGWAHRNQRALETILVADRGRFYDPTTERTLMSWIFTDLAEQGIPSFKIFIQEKADSAKHCGPLAGDYVEAELLVTTFLRSIRLRDGSRQELRVPDRVLRVHTAAGEPLAAGLLRIARRWEARFVAAPE